MTVVSKGLLEHVEMGIKGMHSNNYLLQWYTDRITGVTPATTIYSLPYWVWQGVMLLWSLWIVNALIRWSQWVWKAWTAEGIWKNIGWIKLSDKNTTDQ